MHFSAGFRRAGGRQSGTTYAGPSKAMAPGRAALRSLRENRCDVVLSVATHFRPPGDSPVEAMRINYENLKALIAQVQAE